jgi:hypothetical protein
MQITQRPYSNNFNNQPNFAARVKLNGILNPRFSYEFSQVIESLKHCGDDAVEQAVNYNPKRNKYTLETKLNVPSSKPLKKFKGACKHPDDLLPLACRNLALAFADKLAKKSKI